MAKPTIIKPGQLFQLGNRVFKYSVDGNGDIQFESVKSQDKKDKAFVPPTIKQAEDYFESQGYDRKYGADFVKHYELAEPKWTDKGGNPIRAWKQKAQSVWFKPERKIHPKEETQQSQNSSGLQEGMVV